MFFSHLRPKRFKELPTLNTANLIYHTDVTNNSYQYIWTQRFVHAQCEVESIFHLL